MSRAAAGVTAIAHHGGPGRARRPGDEDERCPVCKSDRYMNPDIRFLVNPDCYHKMCESCVDRIFSHGPANCPIAGCHRTLRKNKFREQTFEDVKVEREVDIRRRIARIFNRREEDFESLKDYNDYLNEVEDLTFNLIQGIDVDATERKINAYERENKQEITRNSSLADNELRSLEARQAAEKEQAKLRREAARREVEQERRDKVEGREAMLDRLARGDVDANAVAKDARNVSGALKKSGLRKGVATVKNEPEQNKGIQFKGIRKRVEPEKERPYDPFEGITLQKQYYVLQESYPWDYLDKARRDVRHNAGGYDLSEYYNRALCDAFAGLGVFVEEEMTGKDIASTASVGLAAATIASAGGATRTGGPKRSTVDNDDVFG